MHTPYVSSTPVRFVRRTKHGDCTQFLYAVQNVGIISNHARTHPPTVITVPTICTAS